jgi:predicted DNA-binding transcriptional regulator YafY
MPPLMFSEDEIEALVLGSRWVADRGDTRLSTAARQAVVKIAAVLPPDLRESLDASALLVGPGGPEMPDEVDLSVVRQAIRTERKLSITYRDLKEVESQRTIWPFALAYFDRVRMVIAWCELRRGFRHFRTDRIRAMTPTSERYPRRRQALLSEWRELEKIPSQ